MKQTGWTGKQFGQAAAAAVAEFDCGWARLLLLLVVLVVLVVFAARGNLGKTAHQQRNPLRKSATTPLALHPRGRTLTAA